MQRLQAYKFQLRPKTGQESLMRRFAAQVNRLLETEETHLLVERHAIPLEAVHRRIRVAIADGDACHRIARHHLGDVAVTGGQRPLLHLRAAVIHRDALER